VMGSTTWLGTSPNPRDGHGGGLVPTHRTGVFG
jgi:hypothetical protein